MFFDKDLILDESVNFVDEDFDQESYHEACLFAELASLDDETRKAVAESEEAAILEAKGKISRKTIIRLNKKDDLSKRQVVAAYQLAKDANDPLWTKFVFYSGKKKEFKEKIIKKYGNKAVRVAKQSQKDFLKRPATKLLKVADLAKSREKTEK